MQGLFAVGGRFLAYGEMKRLLLKMLGFRVQGGIEFHLKMAKGYIHRNLTAQRVSNDICHTIEKCVASCKSV